MCSGVARPESAAGSSPGAVTSKAGCAAFQHFSTLRPSGFACQHGALQAPCQHFSLSRSGGTRCVPPTPLQPAADIWVCTYGQSCALVQKAEVLTPPMVRDESSGILNV